MGFAQALLSHFAFTPGPVDALLYLISGLRVTGKEVLVTSCPRSMGWSNSSSMLWSAVGSATEGSFCMAGFPAAVVTQQNDITTKTAIKPVTARPII